MRRRRRRRRRYGIAPAGMFATERELCDALIPLARAEGYYAHPETSGWDVLLVCKTTGEQVGIQAKLRAGMDVLCQAIEQQPYTKGPDVHAVIVRELSAPFETLAQALDVGYLCGAEVVPGAGGSIRRELANVRRWQHREGRLWVPPAEVHVPAGVPGPSRVTPWKVAACRACALLKTRGYVTKADFARLGISIRWWLDPTFGPVLRSDGAGKYFASGLGEMPDDRWPEIAAALEAAALQEAV